MSDYVCEEIVKEFLVESYENLDSLDREFVALEADPTELQRITVIFRTIHTIKGTSGFLGYSKLEALTHVGENLLAKLRDGILVLTPEMTSALLALVDTIRTLLRRIESTGDEGSQTCNELVDRLSAFVTGTHTSKAVASAVKTATAATATKQHNETPSLEQPEEDHASGATGLGAEHEQLASQNEKAVSSNEPPSFPLITAADSSPRVRSMTSAQERSADHSLAEPAAMQSEPAHSIGGSQVSDSNVRVDVGLLDKLMNLVGELVLARNQILQFGTSLEDPAFVSASQRINLITTELQEGVMKTRMQPIGNVWNRLPRIVRDLAHSCGKQVSVEMAGKETELDRTIIEAIKDPLTHIVRNAVDHGVETPEVRVQRGKAPSGTLVLRAFHEGGQVNIEISDDGAGIEAAKILAKAIKTGVITQERAQRMTEREIYQLVFLPGFSTATQVTNVSGRGVGMDVVKSNIEKIGGTVDLQSQVGVGTTIKIKIPLTLAIVPALIVMSNGHRLAIPQVSLLELVRLEGQQIARGIENIHGAPVYRLRGNLLPLVDLAGALALETTGSTKAKQIDDRETVNIVVLQADDRQFGLIVDEVRDTEEIVVKPLGKELKAITVFAGATIMGDGKVALILDVLGVAQHAGAVSSVRERTLNAADRGEGGLRDFEKQALLLFRVGQNGRMAIPLSLVARLEEFANEQVEAAGQKRVVQYRGEILPLIELRQAFDTEVQRAHDSDQPVSVVVYSENGRSVGLVVESILDIVEESIAVKQQVARSGIFGSAVIQGKVTELVDVHALIRNQDPSFFERGV